MYKIDVTWQGPRCQEVCVLGKNNTHFNRDEMRKLVTSLTGVIEIDNRVVGASTINTILFVDEAHARAANLDSLDSLPPSVFYDLPATKAFMATHGITRSVTYTAL